jgi:hypothetical protein
MDNAGFMPHLKQLPNFQVRRLQMPDETLGIKQRLFNTIPIQTLF